MGYRYDSDVLPEEDTGENFFLRHWHGHLSLPKSWFLVGGAISAVVLNILAAALTGFQSTASSLRMVAAAWWIFILLFFVVRGWALVGIWRSAGNHEARGGSKSWAIIARVLLIVGLLVSLVQAKAYAFVGLEYAKLALGQDDLGKPATLTIRNDGTEIEMKGVLASGTAQAFFALAEKHPKLKILTLSSAGGRIFEGQKIAEYVKSHRLDTNVEEHCESACTLILLAGESRTADRLASIGFHQPDFPGWNEGMKREAIRDNSRDYVAAGVSPAFVDRMMETPPEKMWYPDHDVLIAQGVLNGANITVGGDDRLAKEMQLAAGYIGQGAPKKIDSVTRLMGASAQGHQVIIVQEVAASVNTATLKAARLNMTGSVSRGACQNDGMRQLIQAGGEFTYRYVSPKGATLFDIDVVECG